MLGFCSYTGYSIARSGGGGWGCGDAGCSGGALPGGENGDEGGEGEGSDAQGPDEWNAGSCGPSETKEELNEEVAYRDPRATATSTAADKELA